MPDENNSQFEQSNLASDATASRVQDAQQRQVRDEAIREFVAQFLAGENEDFYTEMLVTVCRLARDQATRGDVKLLTKALAELRYALQVFEPYKQTRKITIFGSARTPEEHPNYRAAVDFARMLAERGWMVITGAGDGIMKAGHEGPGREASFGVAIRLPFEQKTNTIIANDSKLVNFRYFFTRKLMFMKEASAVALFPGGFGTQDECFEALTLIQTGKAPIIPVVLIEQPQGTYWPHWKTYIEAELLGTGMISAQDLKLFHVTDDIQEAAAHVEQFYRNYHSMRYVNDLLVLRVHRAPDGHWLTQATADFADILTDGSIEAGPILDAEVGELPELCRVTLNFDRRSHGRLRELMDRLNEL